MKKMESGFSLAELLIGLIIASIIATMGLSIAKKSIATSYDAYIYAGYKGISDVIAEANANGHSLDYSNIGNCDFTNDILNMFNVKDSQIATRTTSNIQFTTPNGITYRISRSGTTGSAANETLKRYYIIKTWFPTPNLKAGQERRNVEFVYAPDDDYGVLIPIPKAEPNPNSEEYNNSLWNLAKRKDLLMFYIDNGKVGRINASGTYTKRDYFSLNDTLCYMNKGLGIQRTLGQSHEATEATEATEAVEATEAGPNKAKKTTNTTTQEPNTHENTFIKTLVEFNPNATVGSNITKINDCSVVGTKNVVGVIRPMNPRKG